MPTKIPPHRAATPIPAPATTVVLTPPQAEAGSADAATRPPRAAAKAQPKTED